MRTPPRRSAQTRLPSAPRFSSRGKPSPLECLRSLPRERSKSSTFWLSILEPSASTATVREARIATHSRRESESTHATPSRRSSASFFAPPHRRKSAGHRCGVVNQNECGQTIRLRMRSLAARGSAPWLLIRLVVGAQPAATASPTSAVSRPADQRKMRAQQWRRRPDARRPHAIERLFGDLREQEVADGQSADCQKEAD